MISIDTLDEVLPPEPSHKSGRQAHEKIGPAGNKRGAPSSASTHVRVGIPPSNLPAAIRTTLKDVHVGDRSAKAHYLAMLCIEFSISLRDALAVLSAYRPAVEKYGNRLTLWLSDLYDAHPHDGVRCVEAGCGPDLIQLMKPYESAESAVVTIERLIRQVEAGHWTGAKGPQTKAVLLAHLVVARDLGRLTYGLSLRQAAELAGVSKNTARRHQEILQGSGWLRATDPNERNTSQWILMLDNLDRVATYQSLRPPTVSVGPPLSHAEDLFRNGRGSLGKGAYIVYRYLLNLGDSTVTEVSRGTGGNHSTTRKRLARLRDAGLTAVNEHGRWEAMVPDFGQLAVRRSVAGRGVRQAIGHEFERLGGGSQTESDLRWGLIERRATRKQAGYAKERTSFSRENGSSGEGAANGPTTLAV